MSKKKLNTEVLSINDDYFRDYNTLGDLMQERFGKADLSSNEELNRYLKAIKDKDYQGLDEFRKQMGIGGELTAALDGRSMMGEGTYYKSLPFESNPNIRLGTAIDPSIKLPKGLDLNKLKAGVLAHELSHANDHVATEMEYLRQTDPKKFKKIKEAVSKSAGAGAVDRAIEHMSNADFMQDPVAQSQTPYHHLARKDIKGDTGFFEKRNIARLGKGLGLLGVGSALMLPDAGHAAVDAVVPGGVDELGRDSDKRYNDDTGSIEAIASNPSTDSNMRRMALQELRNRQK